MCVRNLSISICTSSEILFFLPDTGNQSCLFLDKLGQGLISLVVQLQPGAGFIDSSLGFFPPLSCSVSFLILAFYCLFFFFCFLSYIAFLFLFFAFYLTLLLILAFFLSSQLGYLLLF